MSHSSRLKLNRAAVHLEEVHNLCKGWLAGTEPGHRLSARPGTLGRSLITAELVRPLPEIALAVGDAVQCMRQSLDHLIFTLSGQPNGMTPDKHHIPMFPISRDGNGRNRALQFLEAETKSSVLGLLPCLHGGEPRHPLTLLDRLGNIDKHRAIPVSATVVAITTYSLSASDGSDFFKGYGRKELVPGGDPVVLAEIGGSSEVESQATYQPNIIFRGPDEVAGRDVQETLSELMTHLRETVFPHLEPLLRA